MARSKISIHALREEGDLTRTRRPPRWQSISIHALREEGDGRRGALLVANGISIHALREEGDSEGRAFFYPLKLFLSTPSARRATRMAGCC